MIQNLSKQIDSLSLQEKILLVEELWNNISETAATLGLSEAQKKELARRLESFEKSPELGRPWEDIKRDIARL